MRTQEITLVDSIGGGHDMKEKWTHISSPGRWTLRTCMTSVINYTSLTPHRGGAGTQGSEAGLGFKSRVCHQLTWNPEQLIQCF